MSKRQVHEYDQAYIPDQPEIHTRQRQLVAVWRQIIDKAPPKVLAAMAASEEGKFLNMRAERI